MYELLSLSLYVLGALVDYNVNETIQILKYAVTAANYVEDDEESHFQLDVQTVELAYGNEFVASKKLCRFLKVYAAEKYQLKT